eukprot:759212-Hanusia_phi.AAC.1
MKGQREANSAIRRLMWEAAVLYSTVSVILKVNQEGRTKTQEWGRGGGGGGGGERGGDPP